MTNVTSPLVALAQAAGASPPTLEQALRSGTVVTAQVLELRDANIVRIAIAGAVIDALAQVPLTAGSSVQVAVSRTDDGIRLTVLPRDASTVATPAGRPAAPAEATSPPVRMATTPEAAAVLLATARLAPRQASLAPLYANLPVVIASDAAPQPVRAAAEQLLAARPVLNDALEGQDLARAFVKSGLFLERGLASASPPGAMAPDLKAALLVFRQVVGTWTETIDLTQQAALPQTVKSAAPLPPVDPETRTAAAALVAASRSGAGAASLAPEGKVSTSVAPPAQPVAPRMVARIGEAPPQSPDELAQARPGVALPSPVDVALARLIPALAGRDAVPLQRLAMHLAALGDDAALGLLEMPTDAAAPPGSPSRPAVSQPLPEPPPPLRGAAPAAQPVAAPTLAPDATPAEIGQRLLVQTDAALARQTLLQIASLPDRADAAPLAPGQAAAADAAGPRWAFEVPFATPQGTAVAQFEIGRDDDAGVDGATDHRVWRARFTLDIEPAGPVHALVSLAGERTSVRLWAERGETAAQLREQTQALAQALRAAALEPGEIAVGEGAPPRLAKARAGHFLDRVS
jgi:hypothetical protein